MLGLFRSLNFQEIHILFLIYMCVCVYIYLSLSLYNTYITYITYTHIHIETKLSFFCFPTSHVTSIWISEPILQLVYWSKKDGLGFTVLEEKLGLNKFIMILQTFPCIILVTTACTLVSVYILCMQKLFDVHKKTFTQIIS